MGVPTNPITAMSGPVTKNPVMTPSIDLSWAFEDNMLTKAMPPKSPTT